MKEVTEQNDEGLRKAREYMGSCTVSDVKSHSSTGTVNRSASKKSSFSGKTKTSSQRQKDLLLATHRRQELERQNEKALRLAEQKQEVARKQLEREKERLEEEQALQLEELEENRRKHELEMTDDLSQATDELHETLSWSSKHSKQTSSQRVSDWVSEVSEPESVSNQPQTNIVDFNSMAR